MEIMLKNSMPEVGPLTPQYPHDVDGDPLPSNVNGVLDYTDKDSDWPDYCAFDDLADFCEWDKCCNTAVVEQQQQQHAAVVDSCFFDVVPTEPCPLELDCDVDSCFFDVVPTEPQQPIAIEDDVDMDKFWEESDKCRSLTPVTMIPQPSFDIEEPRGDITTPIINIDDGSDREMELFLDLIRNWPSPSPHPLTMSSAAALPTQIQPSLEYFHQVVEDAPARSSGHRPKGEKRDRWTPEQHK